MNEPNGKHTFLILISFLGLILTLTCLAYNYREELNIHQRLKDAKDLFLGQRRITVKFHVITDINGKDLRVKFSVPCKSMNHKYYLLKRVPMIKHALLMSMSSPEMIQSIEQRDFGTIKRNSLQIVNDFSDEPLKKIYVDFFFLN